METRTPQPLLVIRHLTPFLEEERVLCLALRTIFR